MSVREKQRYKTILTPSMAADILKDQDKKLAEYGLTQRKVKRARVNQLVAKMQAGQWSWGINSISLALNGAVLNGQHTLMAVVESGVTITEDIWRDVPAEDFSKFDTSISGRSLADVLSIQGETNAQLKSQIIPTIIAYHDGTLSSFAKGAVPVERVLETLESDREAIEAAIGFVADAEYRIPVTAFMHYAYNRAGLLPKVETFLEGFKTGANLRNQSLGLRFRSYVLGQGRDLREKKIYLVFFKTLNAVVSGKNIGNFGAVSKKLDALKPVGK